MGDLNIICLEDIISALMQVEGAVVNFDEFVSIIISKDLLEHSLMLLSFLRLVSLFDHQRQRILFKKMFELSAQFKETRLKRKLGLALIWSWNNIDSLSK